MRRVDVAVRVVRYVARQERTRKVAVRAAILLGALGVCWQACGHARHDDAHIDQESAKVPAFCKRFDPKQVYLWGEVVEGSTKTRAIAELDAPDSYCELPSRSTFLPSVRPDRRLMF